MHWVTTPAIQQGIFKMPRGPGHPNSRLTFGALEVLTYELRKTPLKNRHKKKTSDLNFSSLTLIWQLSIQAAADLASSKKSRLPQ